MKTKKVTSKFVSILSVVLALAMLSTTVFASGILSGLMADDTIEITNNGEVIELADKPFIENGEVYLPLRETFEKVGVMEHPESAMEWNDGKIDLTIAYDADNAYTTHVQPIPGQEMDTISFIYSYVLEIGKPSLADTNIVLINAEGQGVPNEQVMSNSPVLRGGHTYIPYSYMDYLLKDERWNIGYIIYDKDRNTVDFSGFNLEFPGEYSIKIPNRWVGKYVVRSTDGNTTLIQTATYDKYGEGSGTLFRIEKVSVDDADELLNTLAGSRLLYKGDEYAYIFVIPTDVQYPIWTDRDDEDIAIAAEYERMFADVGFIADSFTLLGGQ